MDAVSLDRQERPLPSFFASVWRFRGMVVALVLFGALLGVAHDIALPGSPTARARVTVDVRGVDLAATSSPTPVDQAAFVANQAAFFDSETLIAHLARDLQNRFSDQTLREAISAEPLSGGTAIEVSASTGDPDDAVLIANAAVAAYRRVTL